MNVNRHHNTMLLLFHSSFPLKTKSNTGIEKQEQKPKNQPQLDVIYLTYGWKPVYDFNFCGKQKNYFDECW